MTYGERYQQATGWVERNIAKDLLEDYGNDALVSAEDDEKLEIAILADNKEMPFHVAAAEVRNGRRHDS